MTTHDAAATQLEHALVAIDDVTTHPRNPRRGDVATIRDSLATNGQYRPIVAQRSTGQILAGNHTHLAARELGWTHINVTWVDVDDEQATRIMAADNRTADLGDYDDRLLVELLSELDTLEGTGYTPDALDALESKLAADGLPGTDPDSEWDGMPEFTSDDNMAWRTIKIHLRNQGDLDAFAQLMGQRISDTTKYLWHPADEKDDVAHLAYSSSDDDT